MRQHPLGERLGLDDIDMRYVLRLRLLLAGTAEPHGGATEHASHLTQLFTIITCRQVQHTPAASSITGTHAGDFRHDQAE
jgi:hypothetical protein